MSAVNPLDLSDEDFLKAPMPEYQEESVEEEELPDEELPEEEEAEEESEEEEESSEEHDPADADGAEEEQEEELEEAQEAETPAAPAPKKAAKQTPADEYKATHERIFAPFKANGKETQVKSVDEAVTLMQMGANYNKKMAALKPHLKLMKLLEQHGLFTEEKVNYLIDLQSNNPQAVSKLLKDSGVDPLDVDVEKAHEYVPSTRAVSDSSMELDSVLDDIKDAPNFQRLLSTVRNEWDAESKQAVASTPQLLHVVNDHMANGIYDLISNEMERERMFGRLEGKSFLAAYQQVGDRMNAQGAFNHLASPVVKATPARKVVASTKVAAQPSEVRDRKRAASSPKSTVQVQPQESFNPLDMSDEDFLKFESKRY